MSLNCFNGHNIANEDQFNTSIQLIISLVNTLSVAVIASPQFLKKVTQGRLLLDHC